MDEFFEYWPPSAEWFIVAGAHDASEAFQVCQRHPSVKCVGIEPNPLCLLDDFPGQVVRSALWSSEGEGTLTKPADASWASASLCRPFDAPDMGGLWMNGPQMKVPLVTLDLISENLGPFDNAVLWLDVEYAEVEALKGASRLLEDGRVLMVNVETYAHLSLPQVMELLPNFRLRRVWNIGKESGRDAQDYIFTLEK
jgi:FkbM family methyltransferase